MNPPHPKRTTATAADICEVPGVTIRKMCKPQDASGDSELDFTVTNTGGTGLTNCVITDNIFPTDATCPPAAGHTWTSLPVSMPSPKPLGFMAPNNTATVTFIYGPKGTPANTARTQNACNQDSVTCDVLDATGHTTGRQVMSVLDQTVCTAGCISNCIPPAAGAAGTCTVLELDGSNVDITGPPGGIKGDVCIGPNGRLAITGGEFVTKDILLATGATFQKSGPGRGRECHGARRYRIRQEALER